LKTRYCQPKFQGNDYVGLFARTALFAIKMAIIGPISARSPDYYSQYQLLSLARPVPLVAAPLSLLEHLLHPNCIEYLSLFPADASETPAFDKTILFMEIYASGIKGRYIG